MLYDTFPLTKPPFVSVEFFEDQQTVTKLWKIWTPSLMGILPDLK